MFLIAVAMFAFAFNGFSQGKALKNGFGVQFQIGFPSLMYGFDDREDPDSEFKAGTLFGIQIGNRWYVHNDGQIGISIMANWLDATWSQKTYDNDVKRGVLEIALLEVGPGFTYAINDDVALDAYYNLRPTIMSSVTVDADNNGLGAAGFGITHALGAAFRYKAFYFGGEYVMGKTKGKYVEVGDGQIPTGLDDGKLVANHMRLLIGFKF
ncbi:MAG: hypothetical protein HC831_19350 [Chloroflexia bacterium]|nr:hypothetical protein [Chloroflexia bacterium]